MASYFAAFTSKGFTQDPKAPINAEFARLAKQQGWGKRSARYRTEREACLQAEFHATYGQDAGRLAGWQKLCEDVGVSPIPGSITQCRKILSRTWVNLVDLINCRRAGTKVKTFTSRNALRRYTLNNDLIFPKKTAKEDGFLKVLLIGIFA